MKCKLYIFCIQPPCPCWQPLLGSLTSPAHWHASSWTPDKAILEATSFTYNPQAVSYMIFMAICQGKIHEQMLRGQKKYQQKLLVRVNRLTCRERLGFLTSGPGHSSHLQHHCSVPVPMPLVRRPWADVSPKLELPLPSSWHHCDGSHLLSVVLSALLQERGSSGSLPKVWMFPAGTPPIQGLGFWLRTPKDCSRHRVGAGRQARGLGSACGLVWDKGGGEEKQRSLVELGLVLVWVTGKWSKQIGTCFILRCEQRQTHDHCCARCWPSLYILIPTAVSGGTQVNFGHLRSGRALTSWRAWGKATELQNPVWCQ